MAGQGSTQVGRQGSTGTYQNTIAPKSAEQAMLKKMDELIDALATLTAKLDADTGITDTDYAALITDTLEKVKLVR
jgi:hypothetical protein